MATLLERLRGNRSISTIDDFTAALNSFTFNGHQYGGGVQQTLQGEPIERISNSLEGYAQSAYASNGVVFACMAVRQLVFSLIRFQFQQMVQGRPRELFGSPVLGSLEEPWPGGTTQDLLSRMIQDADLAGNFYGFADTSFARVEPEIVRLRPDWVDIVLTPRFVEQEGVGRGQAGYRRSGYVYWEGGNRQGSPTVFLPEDICHFAPHPDPLATYRGMSWLTPVIREVQADSQMTTHKRKFLRQGATPNMAITGITAETQELFDKITSKMRERYEGAENAGKLMTLAAGMDAKVVGADFKGMDLKSVQGAGETRIAAAAGVHPVIVGLSEGLSGSSLNAGNYSQARRRFADATMAPLWQNAAGSLQRIIPRPPGSRLWYDTRDVAFLREDAKDAADIELTKSSTVSQYVREGFTPDSAVAAVEAQDIKLLEHTGNVSVQLQPAGQDGQKAIESGSTNDDG